MLRKYNMAFMLISLAARGVFVLTSTFLSAHAQRATPARLRPCPVGRWSLEPLSPSG